MKHAGLITNFGNSFKPSWNIKPLWNIMVHIESFSQTDSQATKRAELGGFVKMKTWKHASFSIYIVFSPDLLSPIRRLRIAFQQKEHDPVKAVRRIQEFNCTRAKLKILTESSLKGQNTRLNNFWVKTDARNDGRFYYQDVKLSRYTDTKITVSTFYGDWITRISENVERRFEDLLTSPVFSIWYLR